MNNDRIYLITGASQGLGLIMVKKLLAIGQTVIATSRDPEGFDPELLKNRNLEVIKLDLTDESEVEKAVASVLKKHGTIDVLINNAGYGFAGAIEEASASEVNAVLDVNVQSTIRMTRFVMPAMRANRRGHIINLSSASGLVSTAGFGIYNASKFAIEGFSEALHHEVSGLGIHVTLIEPGAFRTNFLSSSLVVAARSIDDYHQTAGIFKTRLKENNGHQAGNPDKAAEAIICVTKMENPPLRLLLGQDAYERVVNKLKSMEREIERMKQITLSTDFD